MVAKIPELYKCLFNNDYLYYVFYGGRGAGKSENVAQSLVLLSCSKKLRILCIRENQNSISESVKATLESWIDKLGLHKFFKITQSSISTTCGSDFIFSGMRSANAVNIKSISNVDITWIEEAEAFSKRSWQLLVPSVTRTENPKIIITFNPHKEDDVIYQTFIANKPPKYSLIKRVNYTDNPFFKGTPLERLMLDDKERLPDEEFQYVWGGELIKFSEGSLFKDVNFTPLNIDFNRSNYVKVCIACDPATTNNHHSNEFGIVVLGKTFEGYIHIIEDLSSQMSPQTFANSVVTANALYQADEIVVEVNNGGDFIKALILESNSSVQVVEVRAFSDKINRALPISQLYSLGKVKHIKEFSELERQMRLTTHKGFLGRRGESPDRLDALVWGVYHLGELKNKNSIYTTFKPEMFQTEKEWDEGAREIGTILYCSSVNNAFCAIAVSLRNNNGDIKFYITDAVILSGFEMLESLENFDIKNFSVIAFEDITLNTKLVKLLTLKGLNVRTFEKFKGKLDDAVLELLPLFKGNKIIIERNCKIRAFNNIYANLLQTELMEFSYNDKRVYYLIPLLCSIIYSEFR